MSTSGVLSNSLTKSSERFKETDAYKEAVANYQVLGSDGQPMDVPKVQLIRAEEQLKASKMGQWQAAAEQNIFIFDNQINKAYTDNVDDEWILGGRAKWFEKNKQYLLPEFIEAWEQGDSEDILNQVDAETMVARYEREAALTKQVFKDGFWEGMGITVGTSLASPQDIPLYFIPYAGWSAKAGKTLDKTADAVKAYQKVSRWKQMGKMGLLGSGFATYSEGTRQIAAGIDLNNEYEVAFLGFFFGGTIEGISQGWSKLTKPQRDEFIANVKEGGKWLQRRVEGKETEAPVGVPKNNASVTWNPSPIERLYSTGNSNVYKITSKLKPSQLSLKDAEGSYVVQRGDTAWSLNRLHEGEGTKVQAKMLKLEKDFYLTGRSREEFRELVDVNLKEITLAHREARAGYDYFIDKYKVLDEQAQNLKSDIYNIEDIIKNNRLIESAIKEEKAKLPKLKEELESTLKEADILWNKAQVARQDIKQVDIDDPIIKEAVSEMQGLYKYFNDLIWKLDKRDLDEAFEKQMAEKSKALGEAKGDAIDRIKQSMEFLTQKYEKDLEELNLTMQDRHLAYSPRYWMSEEIENIPDAADKILKSLLNSPYAKTLNKYGTEDEIKAFAEEAPKIAENMVEKIRNATNDNELRDIAGLSMTGNMKGNKFRGKSGKERRIDVDETLVSDLVNTNWNNVTMSYVYDMGHKLSTREALRVKTPEEFEEKYLKGFKLEGFSNRKAKNIKEDLADMVDEALGIRGRTKDPNSKRQLFKRTVMNMNNAYMGIGFLPAQLSEVGPIVRSSGSDFFKFLAPSFKKTFKEYRDKGFDEDAIDALNGINIGGMIQKSEASARFEDGNMNAVIRGENMTKGQKIDKAANKIANFSMHIGAMPTALSVGSYAQAGAYMSRVHRIAGRIAKGGTLSKAEQKYFMRQGLTKEDFIAFSKEKLIDKNGNFNYNLSGWSEKNVKLLMESTMRASEEAVLKPSGYTIPKFMSNADGFLENILTQYMRFPVASYNAMLKNGINDKSARSLTAAGLSYMSYGLTLYLQEQIAVEMGLIDADDTRYDIADEDQRVNLAVKSFFYVPHFSSMSKPVEAGLSAIGEPLPGTDYVADAGDVIGGPTLGMTDKWFDAISGIVQNQEFNRSAQYLMLPGDSLPVVGPGLKKGKEYVAEEYIDPAIEEISDFLESQF